METAEAETTAEKAPGGADGVRDAKGVKSEPTPAASSLPIAERVPPPVAENNANNVKNSNYSNGKNRPKSFIKACGRLESGSGSGDQDGGQHDDGMDTAAKKRKTRRGKPKHRKLKPYSKQLSYQQQLRSRSINRIAKTGRQPPAPYNTTQFLMADHSDLPDLEQKLSEAASLEVPAMFQKPSAPPRTRDSSFSVDSDEDYFYSSPEDEQEFLTKEFSTAYEALHEERLSTLTKAQLIQEYRQLEAKMDSLTKRRSKTIHQVEEKDPENKNVSTDSELAKKLKLCQQRIDDLVQQNEQLRRENEMLRNKKRLRRRSSESSVDSESDSDSSSNSNQSECSCSFSSAGTSPKHTYKGRLDNNVRADRKSDSSDTSRTDGSPGTSITPTNFSNGHMIMNETGSFPT
ncbi:hypothetical protein DMN91_005169 [Ooceraea biroi]|uniref:Protein HEXIM1 n=1 Tax=Ooceraea biroi TaxID=2015173 RepID=A0A026WEI9_OOCBI|nr:protein HEXIM [Ooceraea biroi]EZA53444.1 Protein HEXIM1 [Ooceraea biroi]RLU22891.1 hypothetical protein DMN91_005169 [Ooceraea biroi]